VPAAKWSIKKPASRRAQPAVAGRGLSEGLGSTAEHRERLAGMLGYLKGLPA